MADLRVQTLSIRRIEIMFLILTHTMLNTDQNCFKGHFFFFSFLQCYDRKTFALIFLLSAETEIHSTLGTFSSIIGYRFQITPSRSPSRPGSRIGARKIEIRVTGRNLRKVNLDQTDSKSRPVPITFHRSRRKSQFRLEEFSFLRT